MDHGASSTTRPAQPARAPRRRNVRVYQSVRSAHLERFAVLEPARVYFVATSYDFDDALVGDLDVHPCRSLGQLFLRLLRTRVDVLEVNEPLMLPGLKVAVTAVAAVRLRGLLGGLRGGLLGGLRGGHRKGHRGGRTRVVTYAIENSEPFPGLRDQFGWRLPLYRLASAVLVRHLDRIAFGTASSRRTYAPHLRRFRGDQTEVPALPAACRDCPEPTPDPGGVVFLGAFSERKGVKQLLAAWPHVRVAVADAELLVLGKGALQPVVEAAAASDPSLRLVVDPDRGRIHQELRTAKVAVLLSQPWRGWREQVGLPIVEALAHGCLVVTTDQTGLADWLTLHGHHVVPATAGDAVVADAVRAALRSDRTPASVRSDLPDEDGRLAADRWMFAEGTTPDGLPADGAA